MRAESASVALLDLLSLSPAGRVIFFLRNSSLLSPHQISELYRFFEVLGFRQWQRSIWHLGTGLFKEIIVIRERVVLGSIFRLTSFFCFCFWHTKKQLYFPANQMNKFVSVLGVGDQSEYIQHLVFSAAA